VALLLFDDQLCIDKVNKAVLIEVCEGAVVEQDSVPEFITVPDLIDLDENLTVEIKNCAAEDGDPGSLNLLSFTSDFHFSSKVSLIRRTRLKNSSGGVGVTVNASMVASSRYASPRITRSLVFSTVSDSSVSSPVCIKIPYMPIIP
jgi:hypothetical protein